MRKILFILMLMLSVTASAYDYPYLIIQKVDGESTYVETESATFDLTSSQLVVTDDEGSHAFDLSTLEVMYFATEKPTVTAIDKVGNTDAESVELVGISGISYGKYPNLATAVKSLGTGVYIVKEGSKTYKIAVK